MAILVTGSTRDLNELHPLVKTLAEIAINEIKDVGINPLIVETYRPKERQYYLYCKNRTVSQAVSAGVPKVRAAEYTNMLKTAKDTSGPVTWTLNSIHIQRQAMDIIPQRLINKKMTAIWDSKDKDTKKIVSIMSKYGFESGANWTSNIDSPHFQIKGTLHASTFKKGYTTHYVTLAIQKALNIALKRTKDNKLVEDGKWGNATDEAIIEFRKLMKYKTFSPVLGREAITALFSFLR